ncbi:Serine/threonine-protein phosphatase 2A activator 2 [Rhizophlyctis rosea]|uniref:Serine/threonine-protein phosphatase 2A activator n=1 Tax=Rhizophlyctis rosea TaxID=64517 RepID=A0AAD5SHV5_9FUNG|nr:Serine/threonine-protein phosphatase 2A activator 2 [Rhizophlyctis rosea]
MNTAAMAEEFTTPKRAILTKEDLDRFHNSEAYDKILGFILRLNDSVKGQTLRTESSKSSVVLSLIGLLEELDSWVKGIPPTDDSKSRFGNPAFQAWYDKLNKNAPTLLADLLPSHAIPEVSAYLINSVGNRKRIDYGTGHELHFMAFLLCFEHLGLISAADYPALTLNVFWRYVSLMRSLQFAYWLEPAGSHGVWGLDDYHFLPFMFGASQLANHKYIRPKAIHDPDIIEEFSKDYMYLACIKFINSIKTASLRWHSPMLDDISGVKTWSKISEGMVKMYKAEVLGKLPIMQHFLFGSIIPFEPSGEMPNVDEDDCGHGHAHVVGVHGVAGVQANSFGQEFPACCGIRVPSAIAAAAGREAEGARVVRRPLPFD